MNEPRIAEACALIARDAVLVVSGDAEIRGDWSAQLESQGFRVIRCAGPEIECALTSQRSCPLHAEAGWAVYDERSVTTEWVRALVDRNLGAEVIVARDRMRTDGRHEPMLHRGDGRYVPLRWELANKHDR